jgi:DNA-binding MarR family transcriptional regulator
MRNRHISPKFYLSLLEFILMSRQQIITVGAEYGLTAIQAITLLLLDDSLPRPMKNFCTQFHCDASNITGIIDGLEKKGLVSRQNDPKDRRIKIIKIERSGKALQVLMLERLRAENGYLFETLTDAELEQFEHLVEKIAASDMAAISQGA